MFNTALTLMVALLAAATLAYLLACSAVALRFTRARRQMPCAGRLPARLAVEEVSFPARDRRARIDAWYLPAAFRRGAVIFVHGLNGCRGDDAKSPSVALAAGLVDQGLSVLMIDLRGHGSSSGARFAAGEDERFDVLGAVDWLLAQGYAPGRIGVIGCSLGATTAMRAAAGEPAIGAVVADSPFADFGVMFRRQFRRRSGVPGWMVPGVLAVARLLCRRDLTAQRPVDHVAGLKQRPVLVIHGGADPFVPLEEGQAMAQAAGAVLWVTATCRHLGSAHELPQVYGEVIGTFFAGHLLDEAMRDRQAANEGLVDWADSAAVIDVA